MHVDRWIVPEFSEMILGFLGLLGYLPWVEGKLLGAEEREGLDSVPFGGFIDGQRLHP